MLALGQCLCSGLLPSEAAVQHICACMCRRGLFFPGMQCPAACPRAAAAAPPPAAVIGCRLSKLTTLCPTNLQPRVTNGHSLRDADDADGWVVEWTEETG